MELQLKELQKSDYKKVIEFAIKGMHFSWYMNSKLVLRLYGRYFLYLEMLKATHLIAAYAGEELAGVLMCEMKGEKHKYHSFWKSLYVKVFDSLQRAFAKEGVDHYDKANSQLLKNYNKTNKLDGELNFLAANPYLRIKGIGTFLLKELEKQQKGKRIYLFTDTGCNYEFYEHRGFERVGEKPVTLVTQIPFLL